MPQTTGGEDYAAIALGLVFVVGLLPLSVQYQREHKERRRKKKADDLKKKKT